MWLPGEQTTGPDEVAYHAVRVTVMVHLGHVQADDVQADLGVSRTRLRGGSSSLLSPEAPYPPPPRLCRARHRARPALGFSSSSWGRRNLCRGLQQLAGGQP